MAKDVIIIPGDGDIQFNDGQSILSARLQLDDNNNLIVSNAQGDLILGTSSTNVIFGNILNSSSDTDKFLVSENGILKYRTGAQLRADIGAQASGTYNTIIGTDTDINTSGATIIDSINVTDGVITSMGTRTLTPGDIGAQEAGTYDNYVGWSLQTDNTDRGSITSSEIVNFVGGNNVTIDYTADNNTITINSTDTNTDTNTTYSIKASTQTGGAGMDLDAGGSGSGTDTVKILGSGATTVTRTDASTITISSTDTNTLPNNATITISAGSGLITGGDFTTNQATNETITLAHADTSSQSSINNSNGTVIQDVTLDGFGHVTSLGSVNLDNRFILSSTKGIAGGVASLDDNGLVPSSQLPSYVDDILEYNTFAEFPETGESGKIYVDLDTNNIYRWGGSAYIQVNDAVSTSDNSDKLDGQHGTYYLDYNNFTNKPTIPTVNNGTLTLSTSGIATGSATFTANQLAGSTFTVNVPGTNLSMGGSGDSRTITSSTGTNVTIPVGTTTNSGFISIGDKAKLDGIEDGANNYTHPTHPGDDINIDTGTLTGAIVISDLDFNITTDTSGHVTDANATISTRNLTAADIDAEPAIGTKGTAFNKNFGTTSGTVAQGNDSRIVNGQTAYGWGNHASQGYLTDISIPILNGEDAEQFILTNTKNLKFIQGGATTISFNAVDNSVTISSTDTNTVPNDARITISGGTGLKTGGDFTTNQSNNETITLDLDLNELSTSTTNGDGDYFVVVDTSGNQRKLTKGNINLSEFNNNSGWTSNTGTVTSVGGTGTVNGITLTGTVTSSGNLTLGGSLSGITVAQLAGAAVITSTESFSNVDTALMTAAAIEDKILSYGYTNTNNYVSSVAFSTSNGILTLNRSGLSALTVDLDGRYELAGTNDNYSGWNLQTDSTDRGSITSSEIVNFVGGENVNLNYSATNNTITINSTYVDTDTNTTYSVKASTQTGGAGIDLDAGGSGSGTDTVKILGSGATTVTRTDASTITISSTDTNTVPNNATITISAGSGLTNGGSFTTNQESGGTITLAHADTSTQGSVNNSNGNVIQDITLDGFGHITGLGSVNLDNRFILSSTKGAIGGVASLDETGKVPSTQLPSYVDDILEYSNFGEFPETGESGKIYVDLDTNDIYRWSGSSYIQVNNAVSTADNADKLDNQHGTYYLDYNNFTNTPTIGNATITITAGGGLTTGGSFTTNQTSNGEITINHADTSSFSMSALTGASVISDINVDTYGHVTSVSTRNLTPSDIGAQPAGSYDNYLGWTLYTDGTTRGTISSSEVVNLVGGSNVSLNYSATNNTITISSTNTTPNNATISISAGSGLTNGGDFTTNQSSAETITLNVGAGSGISVSADAVSVDSTVVRTSGDQTIAGEKTLTNKLTVEGSVAGATIFDVQGTSGQLFSIVDSLTGSLFRVNDISGIPVFEVFSDDSVNIGTFGAEAIKVQGSDVVLENTTTDNSENTVLLINSSNKIVNRELGSGAFASAYSHPTHPGDDINLDTGALTGATVISDLDFNITTDTSGHVTDANASFSTRNLTAADIGAAASSHTHTISQITDSTTVGQNIVKLTNPSAVRFIRINADNTVSALDAASFRTAIGAGTGSGDITAVNITTSTGSGLSGGANFASGDATFTLTNTDRGSSQNIFKNIAVSGQNTIVADTNDDTLTFVAGSNVTITTNNSTDALTISASNTTYSQATLNTLGLVKLGSSTTQTVAANSVTATAGRSYAVQVNASGQMLVNVPWTDNNTTYSGSTSIILSSGSFQRAALTGDVTASQNNNATTIASNVVTNSKLSDMEVNTIKGRVTAGTGDPEDLSSDQVKTILGAGSANGLATLDAGGKVPTNQLPSYVDDVLEYDNSDSFPGTGDTGKIYVAKDTNKIYRWSGTSYIEISPTAGNADTATKLATARTISATGDATWSVTFDGSANVSGALTIASGAVEASMLNNNIISGKTALTSGLASTDELMVSDAGTVKRMDISVLQTYMQNNLAFSNNAGDITAVTAGNGLSGGGTSGSVTLTNADPGSSQNIFKSIQNSDGTVEIAAASNSDSFKIVGDGATEVTLDSGSKTITIISSDTNTTYSAGNGISLSGTTFTVGAGTGLSQTSTGLALSHLGLQSLSDPDADRIAFWDDSAGSFAWLSVGSNLSISGTTITATNTTYSQATLDTLGLVKLGSSTTQTVAANSVTATAGRSYAVQVNASGQMLVNVPWSDTNTDTNNYVSSVAFSTTTGVLTLNRSGLTALTVDLDGRFALSSHTHTVSQISDSTTVGQNMVKLTNPSAVTFLRINADNTVSALDAAAFRTAIGAGTGSGDITAVVAGSGLSGGATSGSATLSHADTSSQGSVNNSGTTVIQDVTLDTYGHVTGLASATIPVYSPWIVADNLGVDQFSVGSGQKVLFKGDGSIGVTFDAGSNTIVFANNNTGTVTSVGGTGTVNGITLTGTVTSSGNLTLGGSLSGITVAQLANAAVITSSESFSNVDTALMTAAAIEDKILSYGYTTATGDITAVTAGNGLTGGGTSGGVTLNVGAGSGISVAADTVAVDSTVVRTTGNQTIGGVKTFSSSVNISAASGVLDFTANGTKTISTSNNDLFLDVETRGVGISISTGFEAKLHVNGDYGNNISIYATHDIVAFSDASVKTNIRNIDNALYKVVNSRGVVYDRTDTEVKDNIGFIAQELEQQFPELVYTQTDGKKAVKYQNAVAVLFEAIKEQQTQIEEIKKLLDK